MSTFSRLNSAFKEAPVLPLTEVSRYVLVSDCHRGTGTSADNFLKNQHLYLAAMQYYFRQCYTYIELGDGDELWENRSLSQIHSAHSSTFNLLSLFLAQDRLYMLYGNHDIVKKNLEVIPGIPYYEGLILRDCHCRRDIYLTHGHQADFLNSTLWPFSRFLVRYVWKPLELIGVLDPTSAAKNNTKKRKTERLLARWALHKNCILITGHTHRPMIGYADSPYCNCGSCVHPGSITCIEIQNRCLTLVKWTLTAHSDLSLYVTREALTDAFCIDDIPEKCECVSFDSRL